MPQVQRPFLGESLRRHALCKPHIVQASSCRPNTQSDAGPADEFAQAHATSTVSLRSLLASVRNLLQYRTIRERGGMAR